MYCLAFPFQQDLCLEILPCCCKFVHLRKETVIQKIAKKLEGGTLDDFTRNYTRNLTYVWCVFLFVNLSISVATVFMSDKVWALYNACISYIALGVMFGVEYIVRVILRARHRKHAKQ